MQVVKIADTTLKKRLDEFKKTPSGALTLADFRTVWLEDEMDPPAYAKGKERERLAREESDGDEADDEELGDEVEGEVRKKRKKKKKKDGKRKRTDEDASNSHEPESESGPSQLNRSIPIDPQLLNQGILEGTSEAPLFLPEVENGRNDNSSTNGDSREGRSQDPAESAIDEMIEGEVNNFLHTQQGVQLADALAEADQRRRAAEEDDGQLHDLDDAELDAFLLTEDEVRIKERVWVEINRDYLEALAGK